jgi:hypothetical protein
LGQAEELAEGDGTEAGTGLELGQAMEEELAKEQV